MRCLTLTNKPLSEIKLLWLYLSHMFYILSFTKAARLSEEYIKDATDDLRHHSTSSISLKFTKRLLD